MKFKKFPQEQCIHLNLHCQWEVLQQLNWVFSQKKRAKWMRKFRCKLFFSIFTVFPFLVVLLLPLSLQWIVLHSSKAMNKNLFYCHFNSIARRSFSYPEKKFFCSPISAFVIAADENKKKVIKSRWIFFSSVFFSSNWKVCN